MVRPPYFLVLPFLCPHPLFPSFICLSLLAFPSLPLPPPPFLPHLLLLPSFVTTSCKSAEWHLKNRLLPQSPVPNLGFGCLAQRGGSSLYPPLCSLFLPPVFPLNFP